MRAQRNVAARIRLTVLTNPDHTPRHRFINRIPHARSLHERGRIAIAGNVSERKVLVVDDDPAMREVLERILATENVTVSMAVDGKDALQKTLSLKPDLILLDVNMPHLNGLTFCKAIRTSTETENIPIIIITGQTSHGRLEECMAAGADDYLGKPFKIEELLIRIHALFRTAHICNHMERLKQYITTVREMRAHAI